LLGYSDKLNIGDEVFSRSECFHFAGFIDIRLRDRNVEISRMLNLRVPDFPDLKVLAPSFPSPEDDWNSCYQNHVDEVVGLDIAVDIDSSHPTASSDDLWNNKVLKTVPKETIDYETEYLKNHFGVSPDSEGSLVGDTSAAADEAEKIDENKRDTYQQHRDEVNIDKFLELQAVVGAFYKSAVDGKTMINYSIIQGNMQM